MENIKKWWLSQKGQKPLDLKPNWSKPSKRRDCKNSQEYTNGSVIEDRVGCSVICGPKEIKIRLAEQTCIFNAEAQAIIEAIKATRRWKIVKKIVITDSLSNLTAQETPYTKENSKKTELKDFFLEEGSNLRLMWVLSKWASRVTGVQIK
jgi:ribonuclease HI